jgi:hypothetical protein
MCRVAVDWFFGISRRSLPGVGSMIAACRDRHPSIVWSSRSFGARGTVLFGGAVGWVRRSVVSAQSCTGVAFVSCGFLSPGPRVRVAFGFAPGASLLVFISSEVGVTGSISSASPGSSTASAVGGSQPGVLVGIVREAVSSEGGPRSVSRVPIRPVGRREELVYRGVFGLLFEPSSAAVCRSGCPGRFGRAFGGSPSWWCLVRRVAPARFCPTRYMPLGVRATQGFCSQDGRQHWRGNVRRALAPRGDRLLEREKL